MLEDRLYSEPYLSAVVGRCNVNSFLLSCLVSNRGMVFPSESLALSGIGSTLSILEPVLFIHRDIKIHQEQIALGTDRLWLKTTKRDRHLAPSELLVANKPMLYLYRFFHTFPSSVSNGWKSLWSFPFLEHYAATYQSVRRV